jgi:hypothetical protein
MPDRPESTWGKAFSRRTISLRLSSVRPTSRRPRRPDLACGLPGQRTRADRVFWGQLAPNERVNSAELSNML